MSTLMNRLLLTSMVATALAVATPQFANAQGGPGFGRGGGGGGGGFDPAEFQAQRTERIKERLAATDEEWEVIEPLLTAVMETQREARFGRRSPGRRRGGGAPRGGGFGGPPGGGHGRTPEARALREALDSEDTSTEEIMTKLKAFRSAKRTKEEALTSAQADLRKVLTVRQEACLVMANVLE